MTGELRAAPPGQCDLRVSYVLTGAKSVWTDPQWHRYTETRIPAREIGRKVGFMAKALMAETVLTELWRKRHGLRA